MIPILFSPEAEPEVLLEANSLILQDVNAVELWASGDTSAPRAFDTLGLGALTDCISCEVPEARNGEYELAMEYPITGVHYSEIELRCIVLAKPNYTDDPQAFRIHAITTPIDGVVTISARHISYDMSGVPVLPFTATNAADACSGLTSNAAIETPFTINTQIGTIADFKVDAPASIRSWFGGREGSLIDVYGGEWHYDNYTATLKAARGTDRGVVIRYGKNLIDFNQEENCENVWTGVLPYWADEGGNLVRANIINLVGDFEYRRILCLDLSADFEEQPTVAQLTTKAQSYITNNNIGIPKVSITLDWVQISELSDRVELCDTVKVVFERIGVETSAKVVRVVWDVLKERYSSIEIGEPKTNITDTIAGLEQETEKATSSVSTVMLGAIQRATAAITGNTGGYTVMYDSDGNGEPDEFLILNTPDISTATKVWRWNLSGLGYSNSGYNGTYGLAMTMNGEIVADYITTGTLDASRATITNLNASNITSGTLSANYISGGTLKLGGSGNGNGVAEIYNSSGVLASRINNTGITTYDTSNNYYNRLTSARLDFYDSSGTSLGSLARELYNSAYGLRLKTTGTQLVVSGGGSAFFLGGTTASLRAGTAADVQAGTYMNITAATYINLLANGGLITISTAGGTGGNIRLLPKVGNFIEFQNLSTASAAGNVYVDGTAKVYKGSSSSKRYKHDITSELSEDPEKLYDVPVVQFKYNEDYLNKDDQRYGKDIVGFIAEDVAEAMPGAVDYDAEGRPEMWNVHVVVPAMMKLIQNQKKEIDELKARLDRLEARLFDDGR